MRIRRLHPYLWRATSNTVFAISVVSFGAVGAAIAQTSSIPTYGPPISPVMQGYEAHVFRTFQIGVSAFVPLGQLQAILPPDLTALASPSGSDTAQVAIGFIFHQRSERAGGVDGPTSSLAITAVVRNRALARNESVLLANEQDNPTSVANANALFGENTARLADVDVLIEEKAESLRFRFEAEDKDLRLRLKLQAIVPSVEPTTMGQDPVATPFRPVNGIIMGNSFLGANRFSVTTVTITDDNFRLDIPHGVLRLPGGELTILGFGETLSVQRWRDNYFKLDGH